MKRRIFLVASAVAAAAVIETVSVSTAVAQGWRWSDGGRYYYAPRDRAYSYDPYFDSRRRYRDVPPPSYRRPYRQGRTSYYDPDESRYDRYEREERDVESPRVLEGGPRPSISPIRPQAISYDGRHGAGTIIIDTAGRQLLLVQGDGRALRYPISVGREGFTWTGEEKISRIAEWPDWHPPAEMRERDPRLPEKMTGGLKNPLGAKALYLGNTLYRIHGTNDARSIGRAQSSGCFRMLNGHVIDLAQRVGVGTKVIVAPSLRAAEAPSGRKG